MKQVAFDTRARPSMTNVKFDVNVKNTFVEVGREPGSVVQQGRRITAPPSLATVQALGMDDSDPGTPVAAVPVNGAGSRRSSGVSDAGLTLPIGGPRGRVSTAGSDMTTRTGAGTTRNRRFSWDETPDASCLYSLSSHAHGFYLGAPGAVAGGTAPAAPVVGSTAPARAHPGTTAAAAPPAYFPGYPGCAAPYPHWSMPVSFPMHMPPGPFYPGMQFYPNGYPACAADPAYATAAATAAGAAAAAAAAGGASGEKARLELGSLLPGQMAAKRQPAAKPGVVIQHPQAPSAFDETATTVMLRNIPVKYTREMVLADLDVRGFHGTYDFFYLPIDFQTGNTVGYAFINFVNVAETLRFRSVYNGLQLSPDSAKICEVSDAKAQGKDKNVEQYRNSSVMAMEDKYHPEDRKSVV